jgi:hypothetical protein
LTRYGGEQTASTTTDENGLASFKGLEAGSYNLTVAKTGYEEREIERPLLDETQSETVQIQARPRDYPENENTTPLSVYTVAVLALIGLYYFLRKPN